MGDRSAEALEVRHAGRLRAELVRLLYDASGVALVTTPAASITLAAISASRAGSALIVAWVAYVVIVALARAAVVRRYRRHAEDAVDVILFGRLFVAGAFAAGLGWGMAGILFFSTTSPAWQMFLALLIAGVAVASVPVLAPVMAAFVAFTVPTVAPITVRFLVQGDAIGLAVAIVAVIFGAGLTASVLRLHRAIARALVLAFENKDLVAELSSEVAERARAEAGLREARDELEERVRKRTAELQHIVAEQQRAEDHLRTLIEASPLAIVELDTQGLVKTWNRAATRMFGWTEREVIGLPYPIVPEDKEVEFRTLIGGTQQQAETHHKRKDGTLVDVVLSVAPLLDAAGRRTGTTAVIADATERKRLEEELRQSQKMDAVGRLAGGVAHDFNNLLMVIIGRSDLALANLAANDPTRLDFELILTAAERAAALTRQLLAFSRRQVLQPKVMLLNEIVDSIVPMLRRLIGEDIEIHTAAGEAAGRVRVDPAQIEQVIMNLALNARDAMPQGGLLMITSTTTETHAILSVTDTGSGMDEATRTRAFEPFFTTKPVGKGTGLGLSMAYGIVQQHGGMITIESALGRGTTFHIHLPRVDDVAADAETGPAAEGGWRGTETILLVEDEAEVRELAAQMLRASGYTVLVARDGPSALALSASHDGPIHLVLTDVVMPEMSGFELRQRLGDVRPEARVVYMSGYTAEALGRHGIVASDIVLLQKPFKFRELGRRIRDVLDA